MDNWLIKKNVDGQVLLFSKPFKVPTLWTIAEDARKDLLAGNEPRRWIYRGRNAS